MKRITINVGTHGVQTTAAEMRRRLAQTFSKIPGDQIVFFNLTLHLEDYQPPAKYTTMIVGYSDFLPAAPHNPWVDGFTTADLQEAHETGLGIVLGELARPEND